jgi:hypothetical protein
MHRLGGYAVIMDHLEEDPRKSHDPSRHPGQATTSTPARGRDAAATEDPAESPDITKAGSFWIAFPVLCVVVLVVVLVLAFR